MNNKDNLDNTDILNLSYKDLNCIIKDLSLFKDRYRIIEILKSNPKRIVYKAFDNESNKNVILKFILKSNTNSELLKNYEFIRLYPHNNLNKIIEIGEINIFYLITLEYIDGLIMNEYFKNNVDKLLVNKIFFELIFALEYLHSNNMLHGDIKPDNIIIQNNSNIPILIDFDLTKLIIDNQDNKINQVKQSFGTKEFMAPELFYKNQFSLKSDIWSLGINFYVCLSQKISKEQNIYGTFNELPSYPQPTDTNYSLFKDLHDLYSNKYGKFIINIIEHMCTIDPNNRPDIYFLTQSIRKSKYFKKIYNIDYNENDNNDNDIYTNTISNISDSYFSQPIRRKSLSNIQSTINSVSNPNLNSNKTPKKVLKVNSMMEIFDEQGKIKGSKK